MKNEKKRIANNSTQNQLKKKNDMSSTGEK